VKVIGLTGLPSSGKETVKNYLFEMCRQRRLKARHFSFSDEIKREARARGWPEEPLDRDRLTALVGQMRSAEGPGVLARRIIERIASSGADVYVVEAIRHPAEVELLRTQYQRDFTLAAVVASLRTIAERLVARARQDESAAARASVEDAIRLLERELRGSGAGSIHVGSCIELADVTLRNDGTFEDLKRTVRATFSPVLDAESPSAK
jgi:dephospho-CoA kinase